MNRCCPTSSTALELCVNGEVRTIQATPTTPLLLALRNDCELNGPKYGCGLGECGACTVLVDGVAARSCVIPVSGVRGRQVTTLEGLSCAGRPGPTQQAFIECQAAQCGYCLNGMIVTIEALLRRNPQPSEAEIRRELRYNLCRCGTHYEILQAARRAVELHALAAQHKQSALAEPMHGTSTAPSTCVQVRSVAALADQEKLSDE